VSKYLLNKFLYTIDRDPELVERYRADPRGTVAWWEAEQANVILNCPGAERSTWLKFTDAEREALAAHDYVTLFEMGAHNFLTLTRWPSSGSSRPGSATGACPIPTSPPDRVRHGSGAGHGIRGRRHRD
jgi:hypothetical protein